MKLTKDQKILLTAIQMDSSGDYRLKWDEFTTADTLVTLGLIQTTIALPSQKSAHLKGKGKWPVWAIEHFPSNPEEATDWQGHVFRYPLHMKVLVVARTRIEGTWKAYCSNVPGNNHEAEEFIVLESGDQLSEEIACAMFPHLKEIPYAR